MCHSYHRIVQTGLRRTGTILEVIITLKSGVGTNDSDTLQGIGTGTGNRMGTIENNGSLSLFLSHAVRIGHYKQYGDKRGDWPVRVNGSKKVTGKKVITGSKTICHLMLFLTL